MPQWYAMSDPAMEDALYEIESMRRFAGLELIDDALPDESTILRFHHLLERHRLTQRMLDTINAVLEQRGALLKGGTLVDATIIHAAPSTKNQAKARDPEMHQTKRLSGNNVSKRKCTRARPFFRLFEEDSQVYLTKTIGNRVRPGAFAADIIIARQPLRRAINGTSG